MSVRTRRIVTGCDTDGRSVILQDWVVPEVRAVPGARIDEIWHTAQPVDRLRAGEVEELTDGATALLPGPGGTVFRMIDFAPASRGGVPGPEEQTKTIDYGVVIEGEMTLLLSDAEVTLRAGDAVVQRGTRHSWENRTSKRALLALVLLDAGLDSARPQTPNCDEAFR